MKLPCTKLFICAFSSRWHTVDVIQYCSDLYLIDIGRLQTSAICISVGNEKKWCGASLKSTTSMPLLHVRQWRLSQRCGAGGRALAWSSSPERAPPSEPAPRPAAGGRSRCGWWSYCGGSCCWRWPSPWKKRTRLQWSNKVQSAVLWSHERYCWALCQSVLAPLETAELWITANIYLIRTNWSLYTSQHGRLDENSMPQELWGNIKRWYWYWFADLLKAHKKDPIMRKHRGYLWDGAGQHVCTPYSLVLHREAEGVRSYSCLLERESATRL